MKKRVLALVLATMMAASSMVAYADDVIVLDEDSAFDEAVVEAEAEAEAEAEVAEAVEEAPQEEIVGAEEDWRYLEGEEFTETVILLDEMSEEELLGTNYSLYYSKFTTSGYLEFQPGEKKYALNDSGVDFYRTHVYENGEIQWDNKRTPAGSTIIYNNNSNHKAILYYRYNYEQHTLLTTWHETWKFYDVFPSAVNWQYAAVNYCANKGLMAGTETNKFSPDEKLTRGMFVTVLHRLAHQPKAPSANFKDVYNGKYYTDAVNWAYQKKIVSGVGNNKFAPGNAVTRQEIAKILMGYAQSIGKSTSATGNLGKFSDAGEISGWALNSIKWAVGQGYMSGASKGGKTYVNPKNPATRAEAAAMIQRFAEKNKLV